MVTLCKVTRRKRQEEEDKHQSQHDAQGSENSKLT
jgi:hypothetical protein